MVFNKEDILKYIESELSKGNKQPYKDIRNIYFYLYRNLNKSKIKIYQTTYNKKRRANPDHNIVKPNKDIPKSDHNIVINKNNPVNIDHNIVKDKLNNKVFESIF